MEPRGDVRAISPARPGAPNRDAVIQRGDGRNSGTWNADRRNGEIAHPGSNVTPTPRTDNASGNSAAGAVPRTPRDNGEREFRNTPNRPERGIEGSRPDNSRTIAPPASDSNPRAMPSGSSRAFESRDSIQSQPAIRQPPREIERSDERRIEPRSEVSRPQYSRPEVSRPEISHPQYSRPEISRPETSRPQYSRPEMSRPETSRPQYSQPEVSRSEVSRPEVHRDDSRGADRVSRGGADRDNGNRRDR